MTPALKPYPAYKDSNLPWLGKVPAHWIIRRGKTIFRSIDIRSSTGDEELLTVSSERGVVPRDTANVTMFKAESYVGYKLCWPGDLVINSLWAWARGLGVSPYHGIISSAYGVYRLRPEFSEYAAFIHELVRSNPFQWELQVRSKGIWLSRLQLTDAAFLGAPFPMPPSDEQTAIVRFLNWVERRIRRAIRARQKRIKLLEETKQALIHQAVTGQIDVRTGRPYPEYKDSGVEWLGDVPAHWEVRRLKTVARLKSGESITSEQIEEQGSFPVFGGNGLRGFTSNYTHEGNHALIGRQGALCGNINYAEGRFWASEHAVVVSPHLPVEVLWLGELLRVMNLNQYSIAAAQPGLAIERIVNLTVPLPPITEQTFIASYLKPQTEKIDTAIAATRRAIELLHEFRTRLIADVVTGKLDVREVAARLPEEPQAEESEPRDEEDTAVAAEPSLGEDGLEAVAKELSDD